MVSGSTKKAACSQHLRKTQIFSFVSDIHLKYKQESLSTASFFYFAQTSESKVEHFKVHHLQILD
jgi:hypothetical protein